MNSILKLLNDFISSESTREYAKKEFNAILWVALITITSVLLDKVFKLFRLWSKASKIPGPPCNSFFGHGNLGSRENFIDLLWESHDKYGSVFKLWLGPTQLLVSMKDPTLIKDMLLKAGDKLPCIGKAFRLAFGRSSLFFCSYDQAQKGRESLAMELDDKLLGKANIHSFLETGILEELGGDINAREEPCGNIMGLMFHGCIATTSLIGSILERLVADAEIQDKIYSEIMKVKQGSVREDQDVEEMHLLLATIYESARLLPAGPLLQRCSLKDDLILKNVGASDASKFNPYRFLSKAVKGSDSVHDTSSTEEAADPIQCSLVLNDPNDNAAFLPFGSGMRTCVGQKFVIRGVATLFASLLEHYEVRLHPQLGNGSKSTAGPEILFNVFLTFDGKASGFVLSFVSSELMGSPFLFCSLATKREDVTRASKAGGGWRVCMVVSIVLTAREIQSSGPAP
ncbi:CYTOCHROME P450 FAMILY 4 [Salix purpurea]|uniref:CYTOCHROME P450 FAMILY 4 n=1 Tax=Salix purpurea TaxID=77065 RepID=A0A9Q0QDY2_SALPP|nr:CYTOCHROME P450 FAMILY 4 [Salix purpurea]